MGKSVRITWTEWVMGLQHKIWIRKQSPSFHGLRNSIPGGENPCIYYAIPWRDFLFFKWMVLNSSFHKTLAKRFWRNFSAFKMQHELDSSESHFSFRREIRHFQDAENRRMETSLVHTRQFQHVACVRACNHYWNWIECLLQAFQKVFASKKKCKYCIVPTWLNTDHISGSLQSISNSSYTIIPMEVLPHKKFLRFNYTSAWRDNSGETVRRLSFSQFYCAVNLNLRKPTKEACLFRHHSARKEMDI